MWVKGRKITFWCYEVFQLLLMEKDPAPLEVGSSFHYLQVCFTSQLVFSPDF